MHPVLFSVTESPFYLLISGTRLDFSKPYGRETLKPMRHLHTFIAVMFLFASCSECQGSTGEAPLEASWDMGRFPLQFIRAESLPKEHHEGAEIAAHFWAKQVGYPLFETFVVRDDAAQILVMPWGTIAYTAGAVGDPAAHGFGWRWATNGRMHSMEIRIVKGIPNPARAIAHELGHALGLGDASDPKLLMYIRTNPKEIDPNKWKLGDNELAAIKKQVFGTAEKDTQGQSEFE